VSDRKIDELGVGVGVGVDVGVGASRSAVPSAAELEDVFNKFDANGDGRISRSELSDLMKSLGGNVTEEEVGAMVSEADLDGDGYIDLSEFVALNTDQTVSSSRRLQDLKDAFNVFDRDGNGSISPSELHHVLTSLQENCTIGDCHNMIKDVDSNGDGQVSFDEFMAMMTNTSHNSWTTGLN
jgi:calcium-binding protein CML